MDDNMILMENSTLPVFPLSLMFKNDGVSGC